MLIDIAILSRISSLGLFMSMSAVNKKLTVTGEGLSGNEIGDGWFKSIWVERLTT